MNMMESFNRTMDYLETTLDKIVDEKKVAFLSGYSYAMFSRVFSILTGNTLAEYVRHRKLTQAAEDLRATKEKVIDIALKYGYESADSFTNAFKKFHQCTPLDVRKGKQFKIVSKVQLSLTVRGGTKMDIQIQKKENFKVAGIKLENIDSSLCATAWNKLYSKFSPEEFSKIGKGQSYGMCFDVKNCDKINYMACYDVDDTDKAQAMGLEVMEIPEGEYAILKLKGVVPQCIHEGWKYIMEVFFPEQGYIHSGNPDFEVYSEADMDSPDYEMELWVPVVKEK